MKKNVTIIGSVIYPRMTPRAMRTTELAKEFARRGHNVTIYAVLGKYDYTEFKEKYGIEIKNLGPTCFFNINSDIEEVKSSFIHRVFNKIFKTIIEFPDIELAFKTNSVLKKEKHIDLLITVAIPFPIHWGAAFRKMKSVNYFPKVWIADCGDPYMGNQLHKRPFYFKYVEKWFCRKVNYITVPIEEARKAYYPEFHDKIKVIPQGFDFSGLTELKNETNNKVPVFIYAGVFYTGVRDPRPFLEYLVSRSDMQFLFIVYTRSKDVLAPYEDLLKDKLEVRDYIPREELLKEMSKVDFLVNFENNTAVQSPSKLIDYALSGRPILSLNTKNELDEGLIVDFLTGNYAASLKIDNIQQYNIENVVQSFLDLLK